jgi:2-(1,2-epoxy-1,2-dihydrophenyl)acetyl-CoA isomerase
MIKELLGENGVANDLAAVQERETAMLRECWKSPEHREAVQAFLEKRPPRFR